MTEGRSKDENTLYTKSSGVISYSITIGPTYGCRVVRWLYHLYNSVPNSVTENLFAFYSIIYLSSKSNTAWINPCHATYKFHSKTLENLNYKIRIARN